MHSLPLSRSSWTFTRPNARCAKSWNLCWRFSGKSFGDTIEVIKVDAAANLSVAAKYNVQGVPTLLVLNDGKVLDRKSGFMTKSMLANGLMEFCSNLRTERSCCKTIGCDWRGEQMKAPAFRYLKPTSLEQCLVALCEYGDDAEVLAGGQSLMPLLNLRLASAAVLVDIGGLDELKGIREENGSVVIGALETHCAVTQSATIKQKLPLLAQAGPHIAHVAIRSRGTIGGSLALADPAAEWPACCLALDARIELRSSSGVRQVAANDFFHGVYSTDRRADELLTAIHFPIDGAGGFITLTKSVGAEVILPLRV